MLILLDGPPQGVSYTRQRGSCSEAAVTMSSASRATAPQPPKAREPHPPARSHPTPPPSQREPSQQPPSRSRGPTRTPTRQRRNLAIRPLPS